MRLRKKDDEETGDEVTDEQRGEEDEMGTEGRAEEERRDVSCLCE